MRAQHDADRIEHASGARTIAATHREQAIWTASEIWGGAVGNHNVRLAIKVHGRLSPDALTSALGALIQRHDALRTAFGASDEGQLTRRVAIEEVGAVVLEARRVAPAEVEELVLAEARRPFDLAVAPLMRVSLFELSSTEHLLLIVVHHIVFDGWSEGVLLRDLAALYEAEVGGRPAELPRLSLQYADYAAWHRGQLEASGDVEAVAYWRKVLEGLPALDLPGIGVAAVDSGRGGVERVAFGGRLTAEVRELAVAEGTTPFVVVLAALSVVLGRWACQPMFGIGVPFANRPAGAEDVVGLFVETLIVPVDMRDRPTFRQLVRRLRDHLYEAMANVDALTTALSEAPTDGNTLWLSRVMASFESSPPSRRVGDVAFTVEKLPIESTPLALACEIRESSDGLWARIIHSHDRVDAETVRSLLRQANCVVATGVTDADSQCDSIPLMSQCEADTLIADAKGASCVPWPDETIVEAFHRHAEKMPYATAVVCDDEEMTYAELEAHMRGVAVMVKAAAKGEESLVGVCCMRSPAAIVALLGVLESGSAYVAIDPAWPPERVAFIAADAKLAAFVTDTATHTLECLDSVRHMELLNVDRIAPMVEGDRQYRPVTRRINPQRLAYVTYTSGSTGAPKGVGVSHKALMNFVIDRCGRYLINESDRLLQAGALTFDIHIEEIYPALTTGATLVIGRVEDVIGVDPLAEARLSPSIIDLPTAVWEAASVGARGQDRQLTRIARAVIVGGEAVSTTGAQRWLAHTAPHAVLCNSYGVSEAASESIVYVVTSPTDVDNNSATLPIGRPICNTSAYVLDPNLVPVPVGTAGELVLGGSGLARGYVNRPGLTAASFIPDPFSEIPGGRIYRTGDLVRLRSDRNLEFVGRADRQVKVRGVRIEPAEIEAALRRHPAVADALVSARASGDAGSLRLVSYVVCTTGAELAFDEMVVFLTDLLTPQMIPDALVMLNDFPLTAHGKIDYASLPEPEAPMSAGGEAPASDLERLVAGVWQTVLGDVDARRESNFFELGGDSLKAIQVAVHVSDAVGRVVRGVDLMFAPTLRAYCSRVERAELRGEPIRRAIRVRRVIAR